MHLQSPGYLRIAAHAELVSLIAMLANLLTVHLKPISSLMGPTHGCAYLFVVIAAWRIDKATTAAKTLAVIPGIGGLLALRNIGRSDAARARSDRGCPQRSDCVTASAATQ